MNKRLAALHRLADKLDPAVFIDSNGAAWVCTDEGWRPRLNGETS